MLSLCNERYILWKKLREFQYGDPFPVLQRGRKRLEWFTLLCMQAVRRGKEKYFGGYYLFQSFLQAGGLQVVKGPLSDYISFARASIPSISLGQLPMPIKMEGGYTTDDDRLKRLIEAENSLLDLDRLKTAFHMIISVLSQAAK